MNNYFVSPIIYLFNLYYKDIRMPLWCSDIHYITFYLYTFYLSVEFTEQKGIIAVEFTEHAR